MGRSLYRIIIRFVFADATADTHRHLQAKTSSIRCQRSSVAAKPGTDVCSRIKAGSIEKYGRKQDQAGISRGSM